MSNITKFAGRYNVNDYAYGCNSIGNNPAQQMGAALTVGIGITAAGAATVTLNYAYTTLPDSSQLFPLNINAPIIIGSGSNAETVTPTAVANATSNAGQLTCTLTATFANAHGIGDAISSGTFGLQEAINAANAAGGGTVVITATWYSRGGTAAMVSAAVLPTNGTVTIEDISTGAGGTTLATVQNSLSAIAAPATATSATVASQPGVTGTWTAITEHVRWTYVTALGGETVQSNDYSFTATASVAIGGSGPATVANVVGYRVYIGANNSTTCYLVPAIAANGTVIQAGPLACFKIGTPFSVATATTASAIADAVQLIAFPTGVQTVRSQNMAQPFPTVTGPLQTTGTVSAGTAAEWAKVQLPTGYLNTINSTLRLRFYGYFTPVSTATLILSIVVGSVYNTTETTIWTVTTPATSGTTAANINGDVMLFTAATGATGTIEAHGTIIYGGATGTAGLLVSAGDSVQAASSAIDLTKQDYIAIYINSGTANLTTSQCRKLVIEPLI